MSCTYCHRDMTIAAKGLCRACYSRLQKHGTLEYLRKGKSQTCTVEGCGYKMASRGLCGMHLQRMRKHGHTDSTRPETWGEINKHPLTEQWNYLHHKKGIELCALEWRTDFRRFVADVGERPTPEHRLKPKDRNRLIGPDNFIWFAPEYPRQEGETQKQAERRAERARRADNPDKFKQYDLRKKYSGLNLADVSRLSEKQKNCCAICAEPETTKIKGKLIALAVDHNHETGKVRGLLCVKCNRGLGLFKDNRKLLLRAAAYLAKHTD